MSTHVMTVEIFSRTTTSHPTRSVRFAKSVTGLKMIESTNEEYSHTQDIPKAVREAVLKRDNYRCRRCGKEDNLTLHHVIPRGQGGKHVEDNLVTVCWMPCHSLLEAHEVEVKLLRGHWYFSC
jgi:hypothetical protein